MSLSSPGATTVYAARKILTMNPARPEATHVAVRDGRILGVGALADLAGWGPATLDERFAGQVLMPGLVEGHSHLMAGTFWRYTYCGRFDVRDPDGRTWPGAGSLDAVVAALVRAAAAAGGDAPIVGWGFDPIYFGSRRCTREDLDRVSTTRPVGVMHASGHILNVNTVALQRAGFLRAGIDHPAFPLGADGLPTGELKGPEAMLPVLDHVGLNRSFLSGDEFGIRAFGKLCVRAGVTTATDLAATLADDEVATLLSITAEDAYPVRIVPLLRFIGMKPSEAVDRAVALRARSSQQLRLGRIKVVADGSIQGFSARLRWPGYYNGAPNGLWYTAPEAMREVYTLGLARGVQVHTHTNGDEATEAVLDAFEQALRSSPSRDHRYTLQHCQLADAAQYRRMQALGLSVNLFANHHFYWGDQHHETTVGPERAERMNACRTAMDSGVPFAIHSDAPITPIGPLFTAWCAVHRRTVSGRVLGAHECIGVADALRAITLGAAYTLGLDGEVGSIECGKRADFCVLDDDPTAIDPERLKDLPVWGTVQGGRVFAAG
ncbi:amidohydrolase [Ideonella sp. A 288]|uniref:amidohydrolase n=1 Tax=Ideonella sp. A 288 TaxID=1962181 RepID=UPI000B4B259E|nr:amidohydrolase [Ideonella sp. A 288]